MPRREPPGGGTAQDEASADFIVHLTIYTLATSDTRTGCQSAPLLIKTPSACDEHRTTLGSPAAAVMPEVASRATLNDAAHHPQEESRVLAVADGGVRADD
jgi:hypothetical protein